MQNKNTDKVFKMCQCTMKESFTKHLSFSLLAKNLKNKVLKGDPQIILGFFDPDPVLLAQQGVEQRTKKLRSSNHSGIF